MDAILADGWVQQIEWFPSIDFTNAAARRRLAHSAGSHPLSLPALWVADRQTAGRGRLQRTWWSPEGCLMLTLAIGEQSLPRQAQDWNQLALVSGLAVANAVASFLEPHEVQLKWPNDVYVGGKKIAGILIESDARVWLVGIGLNVHLDWSQAPEEVRRRATCVTSASGRQTSRQVVLVELLQQLHQVISGWAQGKLDWHAAWHQRCLLTGRVIHAYLREEQQIVGVCEGIDLQGRLIVRHESGVVHLTAGEIRAWQ